VGKAISDSQVHSTKEDILQYLLRCEQATAQELADTLEVSPQAIRRHLKDLEVEGLLLCQAVQSGMGRPQHFYKLSRAGRQRFPGRYEQFAVSLLDTLSETVSPEQFGHILRQQWLRKVEHYRQVIGTGPIEERLEKLVEIRRSEGYMSEYQAIEDDSTATAQTYRVSEYTCSIAHVAESFPQICDYELELFAALLSDCKIERVQWLMNGEHRCGYLVQALQPE
jgi:DeoR family suf operon transcriptional repressor